MPQFQLDTSGIVNVDPRVSESYIGSHPLRVTVWAMLDSFTQAYITAAFWTEEEQLAEQQGEDGGDAAYSQGAVKGYSDLAPETLASILADCAQFQATDAYRKVREAEDNEELGDLFETDGGVSSQAGHDFWLTRNGHGAGFWDGDWPEPHGEALCGVAESFPDVSLYVGGDGKIYT